MSKDLNKIMELINSVKAFDNYEEVELIGSKESFNKLIESGFPLENYRHYETSFDDSKIFIIPYKPISIKTYYEDFEGNEEYGRKEIFDFRNA